MVGKKITLEYLAQSIEELALMTKRGFDQTATKDELHVLETRMGGIEGRMGGIEGRMGGIEGRVDGFEVRMDGIEKKLTDGFLSVNAQLRQIRDDISDLPDIREALYDHTHRIEKLERKVQITK